MSEKYCWKAMINKTTDTLDILLHDEIGFWGDNSKDFAKLLKENNSRVLNVEINSPGGSVFDGFAIYNTIKDHDAPVNIKITGVAASIASVIAMAGDSKPEMPENAMMMIHKPMIRGGGNAKELAQQIEVLNKMQAQIVSAYKRHSTATEEELNDMIDKTTWMTAEEAGSFGLATFVPEKVSISNRYDFSMYNYAEIPAHVAEKYSLDPEKEPENTILDKFVDLLNLKKEPDKMAKEDFENKITELEAVNQSLEADKQALVTENSTLKAENIELKNEKVTIEAGKITDGFKSFLNGLVSEGKVKPVDFDNQLAKLEALNKVSVDLGNAEKKILSDLAPVVDVSGEQFANKKTAPKSASETALENAIEEKMKNGMNYKDAVLAVHSEKPELISSEE